MKIGKVEFADIMPYIVLFILGYIPVILLTTYWPTLSLFLPRLMGYA
jgi:TRAP-type C4-dicarboxylate transport system permease large subunit